MAEQAVVSNAESVKFIPLSLIEIPDNWNTRSGKWQDASNGPAEEGESFEGLRGSIRANGQDTACTVTENAVGAKKPFRLVAGFRRTRAIALNGVEDGNKDPNVKCIVKKYDAVQARAANLRENTGRDSLKPADLAWGIADLLRLQPTLTDKQIGIELDRSQTYINLLHRIMAGLNPKVAGLWRDASKDVPVSQMIELAEKCSKDRQEEQFAVLLKGPPEKEDKGPNAWKDSVKKRCHAAGFMLGTLERTGVLKMNKSALGTEVEWYKDAVSVPSKADNRDHGVFSRVFAKGYAEGLTPPPEEADEKAEEKAGKVAEGKGK